MRVISLFIVLIFFAACSSDNNDYLKPRNLLEYGIPLTILAPDSVDIKKENMVVQDEVIIKSQNSDDYNVRVYFGEATKSAEAAKAEQLRFLQETSIFSKVILDEPHGFIYEDKISDDLFSYGFRRILVQGDREYLFQSGNGIFTQAQAEEMYRATVPQEMKKK